jgi:AcrR family transcriptional regulator
VAIAEVQPDRRQRRRQETIEQALDLAVDVMTEQGVAGLSLGEVARRMGIRTPSLYVYFPSKTAMYDALFMRGSREVLDVIQQAQPGIVALPDLAPQLETGGFALARWCLANPTYAQLLYWRPVPGFTPSPEAYEPAIALVEFTRTWLLGLQADGLLKADRDIDAVLRDWIILTTGVISQQLANAPDEPAETGRFTSALPGLAAMFAREHGTLPHPPSGKKTAMKQKASRTESRSR